MVKTREELFNKVKQELGAHTQLKEKLFYLALEELEKMHDLDLILEATEVRHTIDPPLQSAKA